MTRRRSFPSRAALLALSLATLALFAAPGAHAEAGAAGPQSAGLGFYTPAVVVHEGGSLTFVNLDTDPHNFIADGVYGSSTNSWCHGYQTGKCPRFWSKTTTVGTEPQTPVLGVEALPAGTYAFRCTVHPGTMKGTLTVV